MQRSGTGWDLWVACSSFLEKDIAHHRNPLLHNGHPCFDAQEERVLLGYLVAAELWSSDICCCPPCRLFKRFPPLGLKGQPQLFCCPIGQVAPLFKQWTLASSSPIDEDMPSEVLSDGTAKSSSRPVVKPSSSTSLCSTPVLMLFDWVWQRVRAKKDPWVPLPRGLVPSHDLTPHHLPPGDWF